MSKRTRGLSPDDLDVLTEIAMRHVALLQKLRDALEADDTVHALEIARQVCGIAEETNKT